MSFRNSKIFDLHTERVSYIIGKYEHGSYVLCFPFPLATAYKIQIDLDRGLAAHSVERAVVCEFLIIFFPAPA